MLAFVRAVDAGSFAAAAEQLSLTPAMVGRQVRWLEDRLGVQLLTRTTRRQGLTEAGRIYHERARALIADSEAADESVARMRSAPRGVLRVSAPVSFGTALLAPILPDYLAVHPEVRIQLSLTNRIVDLVEEGYDLAIRTGDLPDSGLVARALAPYPLVVCAAPGYLARRGVPAMPADLTDHACLGFHPNAPHETWAFDDAEGEIARVRVSGPMASDSGQALRVAAIGGAGVILQAEALLADDLRSGALVRLLEGFGPRPLPVHIVYGARAPTPKLRSFIDFASARLGRQ